MTAASPADPTDPPRTALVAGATGGLGSAIAADLDRRGYELTLVARRQDHLDALAVPGRRLAVDLRTPEGCRAAVDASVGGRVDGRLGAVVNATGIVAFGPAGDLSLDALEELFLTNTFLPILLAQAALPHLAPGGTLVNLSGVIAERNLPGMAAYGASKAALRAFDEAFAREARRAKVRVIDARPPHTDTGFADHPIEGEAPRMPAGLAPSRVASVIGDALDGAVTDLPSEAFQPA